MPETAPIFYDPTGRRSRLLTRGGAVLALLLAVSTTLFALSLLAVPFLPRIPGVSMPAVHSKRPVLPLLASKQEKELRFALRQSRMQLWKEIARAASYSGAKRPSPARPTTNIVGAFYAGWQGTGIHSLRANADNLTHLFPEWLHLDAAGDRLDGHDWNAGENPLSRATTLGENPEVLKLARDYHFQIHPILNNSDAGGFDPKRVHLLLDNPAAQRQVAANLRAFLLREHLGGVNVDFEDLAPADYARLPEFLQVLRAALKPAGLAVSLDLEASSVNDPSEDLADSVGDAAEVCDFVVLMAYDEHWATAKPGPIASAGWYYRTLQNAEKVIPAAKLVVGLGNYAYDWKEGEPRAQSLTYQQALILARNYHNGADPGTVCVFDRDALNTFFTYTDDAGKFHETWMLDGLSAYNQWLLASRGGTRGTALWLMGEEDPCVWNFLDRALKAPPALPALEDVEFPYEVEYDQGNGEIVSVAATPGKGHRRVRIDARTGLVTDMAYQAYPSSYLMHRSTRLRHTLALTFDDGPDPQWTPEILDVLKENGVPGTFFVIGKNAEANPDLLRRMYREGHEIGNHTYSHPENFARISDRWVRLELNLTQRIVQSILGRSTMLFRPPYNADAEPTSPEEVRPVAIASSLGYLFVGEFLDPHDWDPERTGPDGKAHRVTGEELADEIVRKAHGLDTPAKGNAVLLHDGGGDRSTTVAALRIALPQLKKEGFHFVLASELAHVSREVAMPEVRRGDLPLVGLDRAVFEGKYVAETALGIGFLLAIFLGVGRALFIALLAIASRIAEKRRHFDDSFQPPVSVLIAAYNEGPVIARTVRSILANDYPGLEVIVVDDGSRDDTAEVVEREFGCDVRVRLLRQENSGKATALNRALAAAHGELIVGLDADTQISPDAIALLARHFADPKVGAVAGNVKVGNRRNLLTRWQALEYITSQNLDRRAYSLLNCVTVVPGAIGAWRKDAVDCALGYVTDTLAEDMDLTWRLRRKGWKIETENAALAYTEAPETLKGFFRQRFRWAYGTLQCLWKHRGALGRYGWFGCLALPTLWLFQIVFQVIAPLVDLQIVYTVSSFLESWLSRGIWVHNWQPLPGVTYQLLQTGFFYALFFLAELTCGAVAFRQDGERPGLLWWLLIQRFVYRQMMYAVVWKSLLQAVCGARQGWGKLERKGTVQLPGLSALPGLTVAGLLGPDAALPVAHGPRDEEETTAAR